jgi:dienelactone hydrolase
MTARAITWSLVSMACWSFTAPAGTADEKEAFPATRARGLPPFLDVFRAHPVPEVTVLQTAVPTAFGPLRVKVARPATSEQLPAVLLLFDCDDDVEWKGQSARDLASVGYVTLVFDGSFATDPKKPDAERDEQLVAQLTAGVRWLRHRSDIYPDRLGVVAWGRCASQAVSLASTTVLQACVLCDPLGIGLQRQLAVMRATAICAIVARHGRGEGLAALTKGSQERGGHFLTHTYDGVRAGFMGPPQSAPYDRKAADRAWVDIYEFLGQYVEDAPQQRPTPPIGGRPVGRMATIADLMRSANGPAGVWDHLRQQLRDEPKAEKEWKRVRADAALLAEIGEILEHHNPPKGPISNWQEQARSFTTAAEQIVESAERRDYSVAHHALDALAACCTQCHKRYR